MAAVLKGSTPASPRPVAVRARAPTGAVVRRRRSVPVALIAIALRTSRVALLVPLVAVFVEAFRKGDRALPLVDLPIRTRCPRSA